MSSCELKKATLHSSIGVPGGTKAGCLPLLLAIGIISAPTHTLRRMSIRGSWLRWPNVGSGHAVDAKFVIRSFHAPAHVHELLLEEEKAYGDMLRVTVMWNETRLKGPVLSVAKWLDYAVVHFAAAPFIAKMDDDAYIHAPRLEALLRTTMSQTSRSDRVYMGTLTYFNWYPKMFDHAGFGWGYTMSYHAGSHCKSTLQRHVDAMNVARVWGRSHSYLAFL